MTELLAAVALVTVAFVAIVVTVWTVACVVLKIMFGIADKVFGR